MEKNMNNIFKTDDISVSSYLMVSGAKLIDINSDKPRHFFFIFDDEDKCKELKNDYLNGAVAPARELFNRRQELMSEMKERNGDFYGTHQNT